MSLINISIPAPAQLRAGWSALAAINTAYYGTEDVAFAKNNDWFYDDQGGNWACLRFTGDGKAVLFGHDHEYSSMSLTKNTANDSALLKDTPDWWRDCISLDDPSDTIGFIYGWENKRWQRADYQGEDGFSYAGLLQAISPTGNHSLSETAKHMFGSVDLQAIIKLMEEDANITEETLSLVTDNNTSIAVQAARKFLEAPVNKHRHIL